LIQPRGSNSTSSASTGAPRSLRWALSKFDHQVGKNRRLKRSAFLQTEPFQELSLDCLLAWLLRNAFVGKEGLMDSDLISYAPLVVVFVVTGLRMFKDAPTGIKQIPFRPWREIIKRDKRRS
jgi:hypothetical protein